MYPEQKWVSQYGSVTFTYLGIDFIDGGMNEAGLIVDETNLAAVYPKPDDRPGISCAQWMQYQLDNYSTVQEVLDHLDDLRPDGEGWHYLIADTTGAWAVIEYLDGSPTIYTHDTHEYPILTNTTYAQALTHIPMDVRFGGEINMGDGLDSYGRFVKVASMLRDTTTQDAVEYGFDILEEVSDETTRRSVIYDPSGQAIYWRSESNPKIRKIALDDFDYRSQSPILAVDAEVDSRRVSSTELSRYTYETNREFILGQFTSTSPATAALLAGRSLTLETALDLIARQAQYLRRLE